MSDQTNHPINTVALPHQFVKATFQNLGKPQLGVTNGVKWEIKKLICKVPADANHPLQGQTLYVDQSIYKKDGTKSKIADMEFETGDEVTVGVELYEGDEFYTYKLRGSAISSSRVSDLKDLFANFGKVNKTTADINAKSEAAAKPY